MSQYVLGADVGGSSTRAAVAGLDGTVRAVVRRGGANPNAVGPEQAAEIIGGCLRQAAEAAGLESHDEISGVVVGLAGGTRVAGNREFLGALRVGPSTPVRIVSDLAVAYGSGTAAADGYVLVAGTGAVAGRVRGGLLVDSRDGWGWLLGDEGAGFWIGRELVRSTLKALEGGAHEGASLTDVQTALLSRAGAHDRVSLIHACYGAAPVALAGYADLIARHRSDPVAAAIANQAGDLLVDLLLGLRPVPDLPVVLAGSVATATGPVADRLTARLSELLPGRLRRARAGVVGALWTALQDCGVADPGIHSRLLATSSE